MCISCINQSAESKLWRREACSNAGYVTAVAISLIAVLVGVSSFYGPNPFGKIGGSILIITGGLSMIALSVGLIYEMKRGKVTLEEYVKSLSVSYVQKNYKTLFPLNGDGKVFSYLTSDQVSALLPLMDKRYFDLLPKPQQDNVQPPKIESPSVPLLEPVTPSNQFEIESPSDPLPESPKTDIQKINASEITSDQIDIFFPLNEKGKEQFSELSSSEALTLLKRGLLIQRAHMISLAQIQEWDLIELLKTYKNLLLPSEFAYFDISCSRFALFKNSEIMSLQESGFFDDGIDLAMLSPNQLNTLDSSFFGKLKKEQVAIMFNIDDIFTGNASKDRFGNLTIQSVHALLSKISFQALSFLLSDSHWEELDPNNLEDEQIRYLYGDKKHGAENYAKLNPIHKEKTSKFSLRLTILNIKQ